MSKAIRIEQTGAPAITLARESGDWSLTAPVNARADFSPVDGLISRVDSAQMTSIVNEGDEPTPAELRSWGLNNPRLVVTLGAGSNRASLALGGEAEENRVYARDLSRPLVFTVEESLLTDLSKEPGDLRNKDQVLVLRHRRGSAADDFCPADDIQLAAGDRLTVQTDTRQLARVHEWNADTTL